MNNIGAHRLRRETDQWECRSQGPGQADSDTGADRHAPPPHTVPGCSCGWRTDLPAHSRRCVVGPREGMGRERKREGGRGEYRVRLGERMREIGGERGWSEVGREDERD